MLFLHSIRMATTGLHPLGAGALAPPTEGAMNSYSDAYALDADFKILAEASQFEPLLELQKKLSQFDSDNRGRAERELDLATIAFDMESPLILTTTREACDHCSLNAFLARCVVLCC